MDTLMVDSNDKPHLVMAEINWLSVGRKPQVYAQFNLIQAAPKLSFSICQH